MSKLIFNLGSILENNEIKSENEMHPLQKTIEKTKLEEELETEIKRKPSIIGSRSIR
jgi:hypothetical protein